MKLSCPELSGRSGTGKTFMNQNYGPIVSRDPSRTMSMQQELGGFSECNNSEGLCFRRCGGFTFALGYSRTMMTEAALQSDRRIIEEC